MTTNDLSKLGYMQETRKWFVVAKVIFLLTLLFEVFGVICDPHISHKILLCGGCVVAGFGFLSTRAMIHDNDGVKDRVSDFINRICNI